MSIQSMHSNDLDLPSTSSSSYSSKKYRVEDIPAIVDGTYHGNSPIGLAAARRHNSNEIETPSRASSNSSTKSMSSKAGKKSAEDKRIISDRSTPTTSSVLTQNTIDDELFKTHFNETDNAHNSDGDDMMMDIEYDQPVVRSSVVNSVQSLISLPTAMARGSLVVDTNFLISHLDFVEQLAGLLAHIRTTTTATAASQLTIVIPWTVLQELDNLKTNPRKSKSVQNQARRASGWIFETLAANNSSFSAHDDSSSSDPIVVGQKLTESITAGLEADDAILDCCNYLHEMKGRLTVILTNDRNLCNKALVHDIRTISHQGQLTVEAVFEVVMTELSQRWEAGDMAMAEQVDRASQSNVTDSNNYSEEQDSYNEIEAKLRSASSSTELLGVITDIIVTEVWATAHIVLRAEFDDVDYDRYIATSPKFNPVSVRVNLTTLVELLSDFRMQFSDYFTTARLDFKFLGARPHLSGNDEECARVLKFVHDWGVVWVQLQMGLFQLQKQGQLQLRRGLRSNIYVQAVIDLLESYIRGQ